MNLCGEKYSKFEVIRERKLFFMEEKDKNCNGILFREEKEETKYVEIYARLSNWLRQEGIVEEDDFNCDLFFSNSLPFVCPFRWVQRGARKCIY